MVLNKKFSIAEATSQSVIMFSSALTFSLMLAGHYIGYFVSPDIALFLPCSLFILYFSIQRNVNNREIFLIFALVVFYLFLFSSTLVENHNEYGAYKISALVFSFFVPALLFLITGSRVFFIRLFLYFSLIFLASYGVLILGFKLLHGGVFERTLMGVNGPIVFARLMIFGLITALFLLKGWWRSLLILFFLFMALISYSKGPLLGLFLVFIFFVRAKYAFSFFTVFLIGAGVFSDFFNRYINFFFDLFYAIHDGDLSLISSGGNEGSIGERLESFYKFFNVEFDYFWGSGIGMWAVTFNSNHIYPHNIIIEMMTELGGVFIFLFLLFLLSGVVVIVRGEWRNNLFFALSVFFFISSMFSGSIVDARYFFFFLVVAVILADNPRVILDKGIIR